MPNPPSNLVQLAKQGDPDAIAALMNRSLEFKGIIAKATLSDACLDVVLECAQVPEQQPLVSFVNKGLKGLDVAFITKVRISGRQRGCSLTVWHHEIQLRESEQLMQNSQAIQTPEANSSPEQSSNKTKNRNKAKHFFDQGCTQSSRANQEAIEAFTQAIKLDSDYAEAYWMRGSNHLALKDYQAAVEDLSQAIRLEPDYGQAYYERAMARSYLDDKLGAIEDYDWAEKLGIKYESLYNNRAEAYTKLGSYQEALKDFDQAIELNPKPIYYKNREIVHQKLGGFSGENSDLKLVEKSTRKKDLNNDRVNQSVAGCLGIIATLWMLMSVLGQCSQGSSSRSTTTVPDVDPKLKGALEQMHSYCKNAVKQGRSATYYEDCKKKGY